MRVYLHILFLLLAPLRGPAQDFVQDLEKIQRNISQQEIDQYLEKPHSDGVPGVYLNSLVPNDKSITCSEEEELKEIHYEIILVTEGQSNVGKYDVLPWDNIIFSDVDLAKLYRKGPPKVEDTKSLLSAANHAWNTYIPFSNIFNPHSSTGREVLIETMLNSVPRTTMPEQELASSLASMILEIYPTEEERYNFLSALSERLYRNYNGARNPGHNNSERNPDNVVLPGGDLSLQQMLVAAAQFNVYDGGVCNDIAEAVALIGEKVFPDKDVLVINGATHFGVVVSDGRNHRVIDGFKQYSMQENMILNPSKGTTNLRINHVKDGKLREIAVVDTQMGELMEKAFETGKPLLKTSTDISSVFATYKEYVDRKDDKMREYSITAGTGKLTNSLVHVVVAKYEKSSDKARSYIGVGGSRMNIDQVPGVRYQVHLRAGSERQLFRYVNSKVDLNYTTGAYVEGMYGSSEESDFASSSSLDLSAQLDWGNRVDLKADVGHGVLLRSQVETRHSLGSSSWGDTTGKLSTINRRNVLDAMGSIRFYLNQVNLKVSATKDISKKTSAFASAGYQGSSVGQALDFLGGLNINAPKGAQLLVFTGYSDSTLSGYKTKHGHLAGGEGAVLGVQYESAKGTKVNAGARRISSDSPPVIEAGAKIPIVPKKKK